MSSLRGKGVARITNIWLRPLLVAALMPPSDKERAIHGTRAHMRLVCGKRRKRETHKAAAAPSSSSSSSWWVVAQIPRSLKPRNFVELRTASLSASRRHLMTPRGRYASLCMSRVQRGTPGHCTAPQKARPAFLLVAFFLFSPNKRKPRRAQRPRASKSGDPSSRTYFFLLTLGIAAFRSARLVG